jgi:hypothetical protein
MAGYGFEPRRTELGWTTRRSLLSILEEISRHVQDHPDWLSRCGVQ